MKIDMVLNKPGCSMFIHRETNVFLVHAGQVITFVGPRASVTKNHTKRIMYTDKYNKHFVLSDNFTVFHKYIISTIKKFGKHLLLIIKYNT